MNAYLREYEKRKYPKGSFEHRAWGFNRNRAGGGLKADALRGLYESQRGLCAICTDGLGSDWEIDHVIPMVAGGTHHIGNLQLLCHMCNRGKWTMSVAEYINHCRFVAAHATGFA